MAMNKLDWAATSLVVVGALNWGLIGAFNYNLVDMLFGTYAKWVYILVGVAGMYSTYTLAKIAMD